MVSSGEGSIDIRPLGEFTGEDLASCSLVREGDEVVPGAHDHSEGIGTNAELDGSATDGGAGFTSGVLDATGGIGDVRFTNNAEAFETSAGTDGVHGDITSKASFWNSSAMRSESRKTVEEPAVITSPSTASGGISSHWVFFSRGFGSGFSSSLGGNFFNNGRFFSRAPQGASTRLKATKRNMDIQNEFGHFSNFSYFLYARDVINRLMVNGRMELTSCKIPIRIKNGDE